jgi:hypothetical protein
MAYGDMFRPAGMTRDVKVRRSIDRPYVQSQPNTAGAADGGPVA